MKFSAITVLVRRHRLVATGNGKKRRYPKATAEALHALRTRGRSIKSTNLFLDSIKTFCNWLVQDRRTAHNPLAHLSGGNVKLDRRHDRQTHSPEKLAAILDAALASKKTFRGLDGRERYHIYLATLVTGFRADEVSNLKPESFHLDESPPVVVLPARATKNRKGATQPIPPDIAEEFRAYLAGKPAGVPLWPGRWSDHAAEMLRIELDACGIPYEIQGVDGPLFADFHSLCHSFIKLLKRSGIPLGSGMQLARHSDPKLTLAIYGQDDLPELGEAVCRLPALRKGPDKESGEAPAAKGTDGKPDPSPASLRNACASGDGVSQFLRVVEREDPDEDEQSPNAKPPAAQEVESDCEPLKLPDRSSPSRTRTYNKPVNSRLLYH
jgi:integrase